MTLGERIKKYRKSNGCTQADLAFALGVTNQTVSKYEKGIITNIGIENLFKIADVLRIDIVDLLFD